MLFHLADQCEGRLFWQGDVHVDSEPVVSDSGVTALVFKGSPPSGDRPSPGPSIPEITVRFIAPTGADLGHWSFPADSVNAPGCDGGEIKIAFPAHTNDPMVLETSSWKEETLVRTGRLRRMSPDGKERWARRLRRPLPLVEAARLGRAGENTPGGSLPSGWRRRCRGAAVDAIAARVGNDAPCPATSPVPAADGRPDPRFDGPLWVRDREARCDGRRPDFSPGSKGGDVREIPFAPQGEAASGTASAPDRAGPGVTMSVRSGRPHRLNPGRGARNRLRSPRSRAGIARR